MKDFKISEILQMMGGELIQGDVNAIVNKVEIDSREVKEGDIFFAIKGDFNDGHKYIEQVIANKVGTLVISDETYLPKELPENLNVIKVEDTTLAIQDWAGAYLDTMPLKRRIVITGSVGKTSTRDMTYAVMSTKYKTGKNIKNFNSELGLPRSILEFEPDTEVAVLEVGMKENGTIIQRVRFIKPDVVLFTNVGISHVEAFPKEGRHGILNAKLGATKYFGEDGVLIVNHCDDLLASEEVQGKYKPINVGTEESCDYQTYDVKDFGASGIEYKFKHKGEEHQVNLPIPGAHNSINATMAIACGQLLGIDAETAISGLVGASITERRLNVKEVRGIKVIDDTYNAAPLSMMSGINTLMATETKGRHIAILGDMFELGHESENGHKDAGRHAGKKGVDVTICVGENAKHIFEGWLEANEDYEIKLVRETPLIYVNTEKKTQVEYFPNKEMVMAGINDHIFAGDVVYVKASNGMHMNEVVKTILAKEV